MKRRIRQLDERAVLKRYPIAGRVAGWYFRVEEVSPGAYQAEGTNLWGRKVAIVSTDPDSALKRCFRDARIVLEETQTPQLGRGTAHLTSASRGRASPLLTPSAHPLVGRAVGKDTLPQHYPPVNLCLWRGLRAPEKSGQKDTARYPALHSCGQAVGKSPLPTGLSKGRPRPVKWCTKCNRSIL